MWLMKECVQFTCPSGVMSPGGKKLQYVKARIKKAIGIFVKLCQLRKTENIQMKTKILIFNCNVKSVLLYGCKACKVTTQITNKLQTFANDICEE